MPTDDLAFDALSLAELEEAMGELQRRIAVALRTLGEQHADVANAEGVTPRRAVARLAATLELASLTLANAAAGSDLDAPRVDHHPALVAALMYAAPTISALLQRLEQNRRLLVSLARSSESQLDEKRETPWGSRTLRRLLIEVGLGEEGRCALALERWASEANI